MELEIVDLHDDLRLRMDDEERTVFRLELVCAVMLCVAVSSLVMSVAAVIV